MKYKKSDPNFIPRGEDEKSDRERGNILILDRNFDTLSPLMHEYTYQAMVMDLLEVNVAVVICYYATIIDIDMLLSLLSVLLLFVFL